MSAVSELKYLSRTHRTCKVYQTGITAGRNSIVFRTLAPSYGETEQENESLINNHQGDAGSYDTRSLRIFGRPASTASGSPDILQVQKPEGYRSRR